MQNLRKLVGLLNEHVRLPSEGMKDFAGQVTGLSDEDKEWYARQFIQGGFADGVQMINAEKIEIIIA